MHKIMLETNIISVFPIYHVLLIMHIRSWATSFSEPDMLQIVIIHDVTFRDEIGFKNLLIL